MSFSIKQFVTGIGLKPVSADPSNPTQGQLQYADGTVRAEGLWRYDGSTWQQVGSGAGSYDIFFQENLETNTSSNFTSGQNASPDAAGTGTLGGVLADEESSQLSGDRSLKYTMNATAASSDNDFFLNDTDIALAVKQRGNFIGINFYYTYNGDDDDIRFFVLDQDDNELTQSDEYIKAASTATRFSTAVFVPSSDTALRYGFQVVTGNSSKVFIVDDIEFSTDPFVYKNLLEVNTISLEGNDGRAITAGTESIPFNGTGTGWTSGADGSTTSNGNYYTVQNSDSVIQISGNVAFTGTVNNYIGMHLNGVFYKIVSAFNSTTRKKFQYTSKKGEFSSGDKIAFASVNSGGTLSNSSSLHYLNLVETWDAEHVVTPAKSTLTDWQDYTPTTQGLGTITIDKAQWKRVGKDILVSVQFTTGTVTASEAQISLPNSYTVDSSIGTLRHIGFLQQEGNATGHYSVLATSGDSFLNFGYRDGSTATAFTALNGSSVFASSRKQSLLVRVPIEELTSDATFLAAVPVPLIAILKDEKANTSEGGGFTSGAWQTRDLNTISGDSTFVSLSSNQFTLPAGKYVIEGSAPAYRVSRHRTALYDVTNAAYVEYGENERAFDSDATVTRSRVTATVNISSSTTYELRHRCETTKATDGFGKANSFGVNELFSTVKITKIK